MPDPGDEICVLDAVICVHFTGANLHPILIDVLTQAGLVLLVPQEVCREITGKDRKYPGLQQRWARLEASDVSGCSPNWRWQPRPPAPSR